MAVQIESPPKVISAEITPEKVQFKNEIIILISAPLLTEKQTPVEALSIQKEIDSIVDILKQLSEPIQVEIKVKIATSASLLEVFSQRKKPLIIHFIGHGMMTNEGIALLLEDAIGIARPFSNNELRQLLANRSEAPCQLALLNACHSQGLADELENAKIPYIIAINAEDTILDIAARTFAESFYRSLFNRNNIVDSFLDGRKAVLINDELKKLFNPKTFKQGVNLEEALKFHLLPRNSSEHNQPLKFESSSSLNIIAPSWTNTNIPFDDLTFVGRRKDIHNIVTDLHSSEHRCIALNGMGGMGKTSLALAVGRWLHERQQWQEGVYLIKLRDVDSKALGISRIEETLLIEGIIANNNLVKTLQDKRILLILDDVDLLIEKDPQGLIDLVNRLLNCRRLKLLITSREELPFPLPYQRREVQGMESTDAIQAFKKYAPPPETWNLEASGADFENLIAFLDGYPLPIRLAANYMKQTRSNLKMLCQQLQNDSCNTLKSLKEKENRENSLKATLELSYHELPPGAREMFPQLALFPGGLSLELAKFVWGNTSFNDLTTLLLFSMAEKSEDNSSWRVNLPEPARRYAETKQLQGIEAFAPKVLAYFYRYAQKTAELLNEDTDSQKGKQMLLQEGTNLNHFLRWGYEQEKSQDKICCSARITALLAKYWQWVAPNEDIMVSLTKALTIAEGNQDLLAQGDIQKTRGDIQLIKQGLKIAKATYQKAIKFYKCASKNVDNQTIASILVKIGECQISCQELNLALLSYEDAVEIYRSEGETLKVAHLKISIGLIYESQNKSKEALASYEEAKQIYISQNDQPGITKANSLIAKLTGNVDYSRLTQFLATGQWREADDETYAVMKQIGDKEQKGYLNDDDMQNFPCEELRTINDLWVNYSKGKFGFTVQRDIWLDCGGKIGEYEFEPYKKFAEKVRWYNREKNEWGGEMEYVLSDNTPMGHLPTKYTLHRNIYYILSLFSKKGL